MADKLNSGDVYTNHVGGNLVVVDPNKIVSHDGKVVERLVDAEDLVMYANLSARIYPRSKIIAGASAGDEIKIDLFEGELNFLKPGGKKNLDTDWTDAFTQPDFTNNPTSSSNEGVKPAKFFDNQKDFGGFGITSISVKVNASYIPQVSINFTDIRGKTLFEQARTNTPYTAFFHLPYPTFFLTLKGYYGKAVQYQLTLEKFVSRFDPGTGDYLITCDFKGNHIALLRDINMHQCVTAPYMYPTRMEGETITATKGRQIMHEVYTIYKKSNLIPNNFPEYTIIELIQKIKVLDNDLGKLYGQKNLTITTNKLEYEEDLIKIKDAFKDNWMAEILSTELSEDVEITIIEVDSQEQEVKKKVWVNAYPLKNIGIINDANKTPTSNRVEELEKAEKEAQELLNEVLTPYIDRLTNNPGFGEMAETYVVKNLLADFKYDSLKVNQPGGVKINSEDMENLKPDLAPWFIVNSARGTFYEVVAQQKKAFDIQAKEMQTKVSEELNSRLENYVGFVPTIRNIFAIIVAGADTFLRLLDDVHTKAMKNSTNPKRLAVANESNDSSGICYPWPQYYVVEEEGDCGITSSILKYPGAEDVMDITEGENKNVWPEVDFVEEYTKCTTYRLSDYKFSTINTAISKQFIPINVRDWPSKNAPYRTKDNNEFLFEILDRAQAIISYGSVMTRYQSSPNKNLLGETLLELAGYESENINFQTEENPDLQEFLATIAGFEDMEIKLKYSSPYSYSIYEKFGVVTPFNHKTFTIEPFPNNPYETLSRNFTLNTSALQMSKQTGLFDIAPIICNATPSSSWVFHNFAGGKLIGSSGAFYSIYKNLVYDTNDTGVLHDTWDTYYWTHAYNEIGLILYDDSIISSSPSGPQDNPSTVNEYYQHIIDDRGIDFTEGRLLGSPTPVGGTPLPNQSIESTDVRLASMLNTPYFINALINGVNNDKAGSTNPYTEAAYLFLNSLPIISFRERVLTGTQSTETEFGEYVAVLFNQMPALHTVPVALLLKIGAIWWRYKTEVRTQTDPLTAIWSSIPASNVYDPVGSDLTESFQFSGVTDSATLYEYTSENITDNSVQVGVYPELIDTIHYLVTNNSGNYTPPLPNAQLNNILNPLILPASDVNLSIVTDVDVSFTTPENTNVAYYSVFLDSDNITDETMGIQFGNRTKPGRYFILYPSSGALTWTEAPANSNLFMPGAPNDIISLHNGATRLYWSSSPKGYFNHRATSQPAPNRYMKVIDTSQDQQETPWQTIEQLGINQELEYATIEELRGVFNTEQLDEFEEMFLNFSNTTNPKDMGGTLKEMIRQTMFVEDTYFDVNDLMFGFNVNVLSIGQAKKFSTLIKDFLNTRMDYAHNSTTNFDMVINGSTLLQNLMALYTESIDYDFGTYAETSPSSIIPTIPGGTLPATNQELQDMKIYVGEYYSQEFPQFFSLTTTDLSNPLYSFFTTIRPDTNGITFNSNNIQAFAPFIRMYGTYCSINPIIPAHQYLKKVIDELESLNTNQEEYINSILKEVRGKIKKEKQAASKASKTLDRPTIQADDLKLELYNGFKTMNDRWISGINLSATGGTLFERFLFLDRANRDIGSEAIVNIWDILELDSPFSEGSSKTLTQGISSYLSIILANNYFNFIPLPSYINFFNLETEGYGSTQLQGNAMFGTFQTVDYLDSKPAFLCQYVGKPSSQLDVKTHNNGYSTDTFNANKSANNPLIGEGCGDKKLSNKVMGFNVDFGLPNQNIFESVTLDQAQYQNTAESYRILQEMANSGGGGATSMASLSLYNVYASRSYSAKITCMGNVTIQPTQYFQLRYLPMFNGPYLIISVEHDIRPNTIETTFEGIRVPIPKLPKIDDLIQRVNESLYEEAETNLRESKALSFNFDDLTATASQMKLTRESSGYIDSGSTWESQWALQDAVAWGDPIPSNTVEVSAYDPQKPHLGIDFTPKTDYTERAISETGLFVYPAIHGQITSVKDNCAIGDNMSACTKGNYVEITTKITDNPVEDETAYYKTLYAFLREGILVKAGNSNESIISRSSVGITGKKLGKLGNTGQSKGQHLHFEIRRGVKVKGKVVEHILNPRNFLPMFDSL